MSDLQEINEGNSAEHSLKTVESIVIFPFIHIRLEDKKQVIYFVLIKFLIILKIFCVKI